MILRKKERLKKEPHGEIRAGSKILIEKGKKKTIVLGRQNTHYRMLSVFRDFFSSIHGFAFL